MQTYALLCINFHTPWYPQAPPSPWDHLDYGSGWDPKMQCPPYIFFPEPRPKVFCHHATHGKIRKCILTVQSIQRDHGEVGEAPGDTREGSRWSVENPPLCRRDSLYGWPSVCYCRSGKTQHQYLLHSYYLRATISKDDISPYAKAVLHVRITNLRLIHTTIPTEKFGIPSALL